MLALDRSSTPVCSNFTSLGDRYKRTWALGGITLARFANQTLSGVLDRHVMDQTGVAGVFNIRLEFGYDDSIKQGVFGGRPEPLLERPPDVEPAPSIFTALEEQLGLKLEKQEVRASSLLSTARKDCHKSNAELGCFPCSPCFVGSDVRVSNA